MTNAAHNLTSIDLTAVTSELDKSAAKVVNINNDERVIQARKIAETSARDAFLNMFSEADKLGRAKGRSKARQILLANIPSDDEAFFVWANS